MRQNKLDKQQARSIFDFGNYAVFVFADIENCQIFVNVGVIKSLANVGKVLPNGLFNRSYPFAHRIFRLFISRPKLL
jgi:hypothetical protein